MWSGWGEFQALDARRSSSCLQFSQLTLILRGGLELERPIVTRELIFNVFGERSTS